MKKKHINRIPTVVLWTCMTISIAILAAFYLGLMNHSDVNESVSLDLLLKWMYSLLGITLVAVLAGIIWSSFKNR